MRRFGLPAALLLAVTVGTARADEAAAPAMAALDDVNTLWTCLAAFLVFFMQAGFALVETGMTRAKNAVNIIMKNVMDFSIGSIVFWAVGFGLMFGLTNGFFGTNAFFFDPTSVGADGKTLADAKEASVSFSWAFFLFQTVFAATAATIVSGAMAERTKFKSYLLYTIGITAVVYPISGSWFWGSLFLGKGWMEAPDGGFLNGMGLPGFIDFAGSTVVHSVGGWAALAGAIVLGPRLGRYKDGKATPMPGHNLPLAALGVFILWLGWFGFNPGSTTAIGGGSFAEIAMTTNIAAAGGSITAMLIAWLLFKKPDASFTLNGALAGLVGITAGCANLSVPFALLTGMIAGVLVVFSALFFDKLKVDDPVGAISVHGVCGAWGTLATGLFAKEGGLFTGGGGSQTATQLIGIGVTFAWSFGVSFALFKAVQAVMGLRVSPEEEMEGLDITEHGMEAYPEFPATSGHSALVVTSARAEASVGAMAGSPALAE